MLLSIIVVLCLAAPALADDRQQPDELAQLFVDGASEGIAVDKKPDLGGGICMGIATRCDLLPKGICYMQSGCGNPLYGDRCMGTARQCTQFNSKSSCFMQRGCTWVKN